MPKSPIAKIIPHKLEIHGHVRTDNYYWLNERENPEVIEYLNQETSRLAKNPKDVADVDTVTLEDEMVKRLEILTKKLNDVGIMCTHQVNPAH